MSGGKVKFPATVSTSQPGLVPKLPNDGTKYLDGLGGYTVPSATAASSGTFTPGIAFGGAAVGVTYAIQVGRYERFGNTVRATLSINVTNKGSSTGNLTLTGLPLTTKNTTNYVQSAAVGLVGGGTVVTISAWADPNTTVIKMFKHSTGAFMTHADFIASPFDILVTFVYECEP